MEIQIERGKSNYEKREQLANGIIINKKLPLTYLVGRRLTMNKCNINRELLSSG